MWSMCGNVVNVVNAVNVKISPAFVGLPSVSTLATLISLTIFLHIHYFFFLNISSIRLVTTKPPTTLSVPISTAKKPSERAR